MISPAPSSISKAPAAAGSAQSAATITRNGLAPRGTTKLTQTGSCDGTREICLHSGEYVIFLRFTLLFAFHPVYVPRLSTAFRAGRVGRRLRLGAGRRAGRGGDFRSDPCLRESRKR